MANLTATPPHCDSGKLCTTVGNDGDSAVTVTVDIFVCAEHFSQSATIPAHDSVRVCVQPASNGDCVASVEVAGVQLARRIVTLPCA